MKSTTKRKIRKVTKQITQEVLWFLRDMAEMVPYPFEGKYQYVQRLRYYDRYKVSRAFWELNNRGLVKRTEKDKKVYYEITNQGRLKSLKYAYLRKSKVAKANGLSTIVIFDIPEVKKKSRDFLRRFLVENGFTMLQRSVFISRWEISSREFTELLKVLNIELNVSVLEGRQLFA